ncbi:hypothetical protein SK128_013744 [Halocaridina rubra]|uniref:Kelch domain-containing protein 10 n=1 Tax=Halocaridina rubra TaxID=373956 RepID=A0AAN8WX68_HALRR
MIRSDKLMEEIQTWTTEDYIPLGRSGHRISCSDSFLYCVGGYHPAYGTLREAWRLNLSTGEWEQLSDSSATPPTSISHCMVSVGHDLLTFGGTGFPFGSVMSSDIHACNKTTGEWRTISAEGEAPPHLYGQACRRLGDYVYTVGGTSGYHFSLQVHVFHLPTSTWRCLASSQMFKQENEPSGRYKAEIGVIPNQIVVVGGSSASTVFPLDEVPVFDNLTGEWSLKATKQDPRLHAYPSPRKCHAAVQRGTDLYIIGGADGNEVFDDIWKLNLITLAWSRLDLVTPVPLYFHDAAVTPNGCLYIYGGSTSLGSGERSSRVFRTRLQAPPLLEAAWDTFTINCPAITIPMPDYLTVNQGGPTHSDFLEAGVPRGLVERLNRLAKNKRYR